MGFNKVPEQLLFVGGDMRQIRAANRLAECGIEVCAYGFSDMEQKKFSERVIFIDNLSQVENTFKTLILPLPYTTDGETVNTQNVIQKIKIDELLQLFESGMTVLAGKSDKRLVRLVEENGHRLIDYFEREELQILNAIPTAEGAIQIAMQEVPFTIHSSKCLVLGYGRIGKILSKMLHGIGAEVTVAARKNRDRVTAFAFGVKSIPLCELYDNIGEYDIIFNTVPNLILDSDMLAKTGRNSLIVDLASKPGGVDFEYARRMGIKVIWALSLPGKIAPDTAGDIIGKTILNIIDEMEER